MRPPPRAPSDSVRLRIQVRGVVQGVGFRPFVFKLAQQHELQGWVRNDESGLLIEAEGPAETLAVFSRELTSGHLPHAAIYQLETTRLEPRGYEGFQIHESRTEGSLTTGVLPDLATCTDCLRELDDPQNRRYRYPFINCTQCGPRFSIITKLPYDRPHTSMASFTMCAACREEYRQADNRRFHAQPIACPDCGPRLELTDPAGHRLATGETALEQAVEGLQAGNILALKGLGGFQLMVDARQNDAVQRLRQLKGREEKPFALMLPHLEAARELCLIGPEEETVLQSSAAPIVLLDRRDTQAPSPAVAPGNPSLGIMLPYTPLHHLLLGAMDSPLVATSGNLSDEPICIDNREALDRLGAIADAFLMHDRPIVRPIDDSVVRVMAGREVLLRRARGYAPMPLWTTHELPPTLALGAHLKSTVAVARGNQVFLSQHIGDLQTLPATEAFEQAARDLQQLFDVAPEYIACDLHPDYHSTRYAHSLCPNPIRVQHHLAHVLAGMAENDIDDEVLGIAWDGTGYGPDGSIWGGETFIASFRQAERVAHLRPFGLPGGDQAAREPRRCALAILYELYGSDLPAEFADRFTADELPALLTMLQQKINTPQTSSMGRLFDAVASLTGLCQHSSYEGQAAMLLEYAAQGVKDTRSYPFILTAASLLDWRPMIQGILDDLRDTTDVGLISARFHNTLVDMIVTMAHTFAREQIVLSGGCFQNRRLLEQAVHSLRAQGFKAYGHQRIPPNDGGVALGQVMAAAHGTRLKGSEDN